VALNLKPFVGASARAFASPITRLNIYDGAVRSGKTITAIVAWAQWLHRGAPDGALMIAGKTERTIKQNIVDPMMEIFGTKYVKYSAGNHELWLFGRKHNIIGANDERAESKIRGITLVGVLGDELTLWAESFFKMMLSRMSVPGSALIGTTNPDSPVHWLNLEYLQRADQLDLTRHVFRLYDNPNLDPEFVRNLELEYVGLWKKRYIDGLWVVAEGAVYDMFDPARHVVNTYPRPSWKMAGIDYGTTNPSVFASLSYLPDGRMIVHDEWRHDSRVAKTQLTTKEHSEAYFKWKASLSVHRETQGSRIEKCFVDPSANAFILQLWRDGERNVHPADNDVNRGLMDVSALLQANRLVFHGPTTRKLLEEFAGYAWDPKATLKGKDEPMKVADHGPDAVRYAVVGSRPRWKSLLTA